MINFRPMDKSVYLYIGKCAMSCVVAYLATLAFPGHDMSWLLISIVLVLSPDSAESIPLAVTRIKANLLAAFASITVMLLPLPPLGGLALALVATVVLCHLFNVMSGSRPALAAAIIIILHDHDSLHMWDTALLRMFSVVAGCVAGLAITALFHGSFWRRETKKVERMME